MSKYSDKIKKALKGTRESKYFKKLMSAQSYNFRNVVAVCSVCKEPYEKEIKECCYSRFIHSTWECKEEMAPCCPLWKNRSCPDNESYRYWLENG